MSRRDEILSTARKHARAIIAEKLREAQEEKRAAAKAADLGEAAEQTRGAAKV